MSLANWARCCDHYHFLPPSGHWSIRDIPQIAPDCYWWHSSLRYHSSHRELLSSHSAETEPVCSGQIAFVASTSDSDHVSSGSLPIADSFGSSRSDPDGPVLAVEPGVAAVVAVDGHPQTPRDASDSMDIAVD